MARLEDLLLVLVDQINPIVDIIVLDHNAFDLLLLRSSVLESCDHRLLLHLLRLHHSALLGIDHHGQLGNVIRTDVRNFEWFLVLWHLAGPFIRSVLFRSE